MVNLTACEVAVVDFSARRPSSGMSPDQGTYIELSLICAWQRDGLPSGNDMTG